MARCSASSSFLAIPVVVLVLAGPGCASDGSREDPIGSVTTSPGGRGGIAGTSSPTAVSTAGSGTTSGVGVPRGGSPSVNTPPVRTPTSGAPSAGTPSVATPTAGTSGAGASGSGAASGRDAGVPDVGGAGGTASSGDGGVGAPPSDVDCPCTTPPPQRLNAELGPLGRSDTTRLSAGTAYYPTMGDGPFPAIAIVPGFLNTGPEVAEWGSFYASWGIVCVVTNSGAADLPDARGLYLLNAIRDLKEANTQQDSPLFGKLSGQYGTSDYSMGGGGTTVASTEDPTLRSSVGLAPWAPVGRGITVPTLHICGTADSTAGCGGNARPAYDAIPETTPKMLLVVNGGGHLTSWFGPGDTPGGISGGWALAFNKVYLEGDERWKPLLLGMPTGGTVTTNIK
jgi:hypothetical protein